MVFKVAVKSLQHFCTKSFSLSFFSVNLFQFLATYLHTYYLPTESVETEDQFKIDVIPDVTSGATISVKKKEGKKNSYSGLNSFLL